MQETKEQARARTEQEESEAKKAEVVQPEQLKFKIMESPRKDADIESLMNTYRSLGFGLAGFLGKKVVWIGSQRAIDALNDAHRAGIMIARGHENAGRVRPFAKGEVIKPDGKVRYQGDLTMMDGKIPVDPPPRTFPECLNCQHEKAEPQTCKGNPLISGVNTVVCPEHWPVNSAVKKGPVPVNAEPAKEEKKEDVLARVCGTCYWYGIPDDMLPSDIKVWLAQKPSCERDMPNSSCRHWMRKK